MGIPLTNGSSQVITSPAAPARSSASAPPVTASNIRICSESLPFPDEHSFVGYIDFFFLDINPCHPCVNESDFRKRSSDVLHKGELKRSDSCFLALHYIIFAVADVLRDFRAQGQRGVSPGWRWYQIAEGLIGRHKYSGQGDLCLIQYLTFEVQTDHYSSVDGRC